MLGYKIDTEKSEWPYLRESMTTMEDRDTERKKERVRKRGHKRDKEKMSFKGRISVIEQNGSLNTNIKERGEERQRSTKKGHDRPFVTLEILDPLYRSEPVITQDKGLTSNIIPVT